MADDHYYVVISNYLPRRDREIADVQYMGWTLEKIVPSEIPGLDVAHFVRATPQEFQS